MDDETGVPTNYSYISRQHSFGILRDMTYFDWAWKRFPLGQPALTRPVLMQDCTVLVDAEDIESVLAPLPVNTRVSRFDESQREHDLGFR